MEEPSEQPSEEEQYIDFEQLIIDYVNERNDLLLASRQSEHELIKFILEIDVTKLNPQLIQYFLTDFEQFTNLMRKHIADKLTQINENKTEVWLAIKATNLANIVPTKKSDENLFTVLLNAKIVSMSVEHQSAIAAKYVCKKCVTQTYDEWLIREFNETSSSIRNAMRKCDNCGEILRKAKRKTVYALRRSAIINLENDNKRRQTIHICCDVFEKENCFYIGANFDSIVIANANHEVISIEKTVTTVPRNRFSQILSRLSFKLRQLYDDRKSSPYSFGMSLSYIFAETVSANGSYFRLKLGLILSLLSCNDLQKRYSSILVVSSEKVMVQRMMEFASGFGKRFVHKWPLLPITGSSRKESEETWIDGGSILLASDGVCVINDVLSLPEKEIKYLQQALENNQIVVKLPSPELNTFHCELRTSVWAMIEDRMHSSNKTSLSAKMRHKSMNWVNTFPMVYVIDEDVQQYFEPQSELTLTREEWQAFFDLLKDMPTPDMTADALYLINGYYIGIRKIRQFNCKHNAISTLISLAKSFAKLSLRSDVTKYDALVAILLYEESLTQQFGYSPLNVKPISHVTDELQMCAAFGQNFDRNMKEFESKLIQFLEENLKPEDRMLSQFMSQREE